MDATLACNEENMGEVVAKEAHIKMFINNNNKLAMQPANLIIMVLQIYLEMIKLKLVKH